MGDRVLDGILALLRTDGDEEIVYRCAVEPHPATRRLMATLGVRVEVVPEKAYSAMEIGTSRDCAVAGCLDEAEPGSDRCRRHTQTAAAAPSAWGRRPPAAEPTQKEEPPVAAPAKQWSRKKKTPDEILDAIRAFHAEHGRPPTRQDGRGNRKLVVSTETVIREFGTFEAALAKASGSDPQGSATNPPAEQKAPADPTAVAPRTPTVAPVERASPPEPLEPAPAVGPIVEPPSLLEEAPSSAVTGDERAGSEHAFAVLDLLALIRDLDRGDLEGGGLTLYTNDAEGNLERDEDREQLIRRIARAALSTAPLADVGAAVLAQLDEAT